MSFSSPAFNKRIFFFLFVMAFAGFAQAQVHQMPAYPLVSHDPYFSIWSFSDTVTAR